MSLVPGTFLARPVDCGLKTTRLGNPQVVILFDVVDNEGGVHKKAWYGGLKEGKQREFTLKALLVCGFNSDNLEALADGPAVLDMDSDVQLVLANEEYDGKVTLKVKWVNKVGSSVLDEKLDKAGAIQKLSGLNLKGDLLKLRKETGASLPQPEDLPF